MIRIKCLKATSCCARRDSGEAKRGRKKGASEAATGPGPPRRCVGARGETRSSRVLGQTTGRSSHEGGGEGRARLLEAAASPAGSVGGPFAEQGRPGEVRTRRRRLRPPRAAPARRESQTAHPGAGGAGSWRLGLSPETGRRGRISHAPSTRGRCLSQVRDCRGRAGIWGSERGPRPRPGAPQPSAIQQRRGPTKGH